MNVSPLTDAAAGVPTRNFEMIAERLFDTSRALEEQNTRLSKELSDTRAKNLGLQSNVEKLRATVAQWEIADDQGFFPDERGAYTPTLDPRAKAVLAATAEVTPLTSVIALGDPIEDYVPSRQQLLVWIRERAKRDDTGLSLVEGYHVAMDRVMTLTRQLDEIDAYVNALWSANLLPRPMPESLRKRLGEAGYARRNAITDDLTDDLTPQQWMDAEGAR